MGSGTKRVLVVVMWIVLALGAVCGIVYCCYWGYEYTMEQRPLRDRERRLQAGPAEPAVRPDESRAAPEALNGGRKPRPRREELAADEAREPRRRHRAVHRGRRDRVHSSSDCSLSCSDATDSRSRGRGRRRQDKNRRDRHGKKRDKRVHIKLVRGSLDHFTR